MYNVGYLPTLLAGLSKKKFLFPYYDYILSKIFCNLKAFGGWKRIWVYCLCEI